MAGFPAFKEWQAIVGALEAGEQILILRKGGIAEGRDGFVLRARRFWLFPTAFHAQRSRTKPSAHRHFEGGPLPQPDTVVLSSYAEVVASAFITDWQVVERLDNCHAWTAETIRERFDGSGPDGVHALVVRVYRIHDPVTLSLTKEMGGCRSWIEVSESFDRHTTDPVLDDATFAGKLAELRRVVPGLA